MNAADALLAERRQGRLRLITHGVLSAARWRASPLHGWSWSSPTRSSRPMRCARPPTSRTLPISGLIGEAISRTASGRIGCRACLTDFTRRKLSASRHAGDGSRTRAARNRAAGTHAANPIPFCSLTNVKSKFCAGLSVDELHPPLRDWRKYTIIIRMRLPLRREAGSPISRGSRQQRSPLTFLHLVSAFIHLSTG